MVKSKGTHNGPLGDPTEDSSISEHYKHKDVVNSVLSRVCLQEHLRQVSGEEEPPESWQGEVMEEEEEPPESWQQEVMEEEQPPESWQQEVMEEEPPEDWQAEVMEEEEDPPESWQQEVEGGDIQEEESPTPHQVDAGSERSEGKTKIKAEKKNKTVGMALPFLTGISPAGFLSARRKQPGGTDHLVQVRTSLTTSDINMFCCFKA